jgi:iron-sulfur cluster assembly protein
MQKISPLIQMTPIAREKLSEVLKEQKAEDGYLRIEIYSSGGCACSGGYRYGMSLEDSPRSSDYVEEVEGLKVLTNKLNVDLLRGSKIDFHDSLQRTGFKLENPNVHAEACGCGGH